jgi:hypothetical protein
VIAVDTNILVSRIAKTRVARSRRDAVSGPAGPKEWAIPWPCFRILGHHAPENHADP